MALRIYFMLNIIFEKSQQRNEIRKSLIQYMPIQKS